jgi:hypothetical protein
MTVELGFIDVDRFKRSTTLRRMGASDPICRRLLNAA